MSVKTAAALGFFDGVHRGHIKVCSLAREFALRTGVTTTAVTFDEHPATVVTGKNIPQLCTAYDRERLLKTAAGMDNVIMLPFRELMNMEPEDFIRNVLHEKLNVCFISCGSDYHFGKGGKGDINTLKNCCDEFGIKFEVAHEIDDVHGKISSSRIRQLILDGDMEEAEKMLSRPYSFSGEVIHGKALGRHLGSPTMNIRMDGIAVPPIGVYASYVTVRGVRYRAVTNIDTTGLSETYAFGDLGDVYGMTVTCELVKHMRGMVKFDSLDALKAQIKRDSETTAEFLREYECK